MNQFEFNWKGGVVAHWEIADLEPDKNLDPQIEGFLREDLVLVEFGNKIVLDLGWLPEFDPQGQFVLNVVKLKQGNSEDWENPVFQLKFRDAGKLVQNLNQAIEIADKTSRE